MRLELKNRDNQIANFITNNISQIDIRLIYVKDYSLDGDIGNKRNNHKTELTERL